MSKSAAAKQAKDRRIVEALKSTAIVGSLAVDILDLLAPITQLQNFTFGENILVQDEKNHILYFLLSGHVDVLVDGIKVEELNKQGDLIGEMSVVTGQTCSATIMAASDVELLGIDTHKIKSLPKVSEERVDSVLNKTFAAILCEKLSATNQKAKAFEAANIELNHTQKELQEINENLELKIWERTRDLEEKNVALTASVRKMEELFNSKDVIFKKLHALHQDHLKPLRNELQGLVDRATGEHKKELEQASSEVTAIVNELDPLTSFYFSEVAMRDKKVLLAETNKKQQLIAKMALGGTGVQLEIIDEITEGSVVLETRKFDVMFTNKEMVKLALLAHDKNPNMKIVFVTGDDIPTYLPVLNQYPNLTNVVTRNEDDRVFTVKSFIATIHKLTSGDLFGFEKYLTAGVEVQSCQVRESTDRPFIIENMCEYFKGIGVRRTIVDRCAMVAEEMLMNCIYDAPVDKNGRPVYNHLNRSEKVVLKPEEQGTFRFACDGMLVAISAEDPFGALSKDTIVGYVERNFAGKEGHIQANKGGAGKGLYTLITSSDLVVFNVKKGMKTEVVALFNIDLQKSKAVQYPTFHYFFE